MSVRMTVNRCSWVCMGVCGYLWVFMSVWVFMGIYGFPRVGFYMGDCGYTIVYGCLSVSLGTS